MEGIFFVLLVLVAGNWAQEVDSGFRDLGSTTPPLAVDKDGCQIPICRMFCEYGFLKDENGCQVCKCRPQPEDCPNFMCMMFCEYGFEKNDKGCDICRCRQQPASCPKLECHQEKQCPLGYLKDELGCDTCQCKEEPEDQCRTIRCNPDQVCRKMVSIDCLVPPCETRAVCQAPSICEINQDHALSMQDMSLMMPHLTVEEQQKFFRGPVKCRDDGLFEPVQCSDGKCFCIDDRRVILKPLTNADAFCAINITSEMKLSFELMHDLDDNDLDGAMHVIEQLVRDMVGQKLAAGSVVSVEVVYVRPGLLLVFTTIANDGFSDLMSASHQFHQQLYAGNCNVKYNGHSLRPNPNTISFEHHYRKPNHDPLTYIRDESSTGVIEYNSTALVVSVIGLAVVSGLIILVCVLAVRMRRRSASYMFKHKKMESMETFKKNLVLSSELDKPDLLGQKAVEVKLTDETKNEQQNP